MSRTATPTLSDRLKEAQAASREANDRRQAARRELEDAQRALAAVKTNDMAALGRSPEYKRASKAKNARDAADENYEQVAAVERGILEMLGHEQNGGTRPGKDGPATEGGEGWARVARDLDPERGHGRVDMQLADLVSPPAMASVTVSPSSGLTTPTLFKPEITEMARDERHVFMAFPFERVDASTMGVSDYRQTGERTVAGSVERDPVATTEKAKLSITLTAETLPLEQFAIFVDKVPSKLFEAVDTLYAFLTNELTYQVRLALDAHVLAKIAEAGPAKGEAGGSAMWLKVRNAVKQMRAAGGKPSILAVNPDVAEELDVMVASGSGEPFFPLGAVGGSSPLFGLTIVEVPSLAKPLLIDPAQAGLLYMGEARVFGDPYSGMHKNEVRLRVEAEALMWVRDVHGIWSIDKAS